MDVTLVALFIFPLLMAFAGSSDLFTMRISNRVVSMLTLSFFLVAFLADLPMDQLGWHVIAATTVLVVGFAFWQFRWIGGGDAKLAAATTLWLGFGATLPYVVYASLIGGALTLALLAIRRWPLPTFLSKVEWIDRLHEMRGRIPYGVALAAAGLLIYSDSSIYQRLLG